MEAQQAMRSRGSVISILITALLVAFAGAARASNFTLTAKNHHFCCTNPPFFLAGQPGRAKKVHSLGSSTGSGYQAQVGPNPVTVGTGANPSIKIGMSEAVKLFTVFDWEKGGKTPPPAGFKYIMGTASFVNGAGTLKKGGGNTGFGTAMTISFCPKAKGPGKLACTAPSKATPASFNGRIAVKPGPNKFGGTMQILGGSGLIGGSRNTIWRWIGPSSNYPAASVKFKLYTSPVGAVAIGNGRSGSEDQARDPHGWLHAGPARLLHERDALEQRRRSVHDRQRDAAGDEERHSPAAHRHALRLRQAHPDGRRQRPARVG